MKPNIPLILLLLVSSLFAGAEQSQSGLLYGERPKNSIFDPAGTLTLSQQAKLAEPLANVLESEGIDVLVVILPDIGDAPPEHVAEGFAKKWAISQVNAVVLHVPGKAGSPWIFPGKVMGDALKAETLKEAIVAAEKRASAEPTDFGIVRAASTEASDALRFWMGGLKIRSEELITRSMEARLRQENRRRLLKLAAILGAACLIPIAIGIVVLFPRIRDSRPKYFPSVRITPRLGAPYSGGNNAVSKSQ
jgi:hypothetical protein